jgi:hypothetical protein
VVLLVAAHGRKRDTLLQRAKDACSPSPCGRETPVGPGAQLTKRVPEGYGRPPVIEGPACRRGTGPPPIRGCCPKSAFTPPSPCARQNTGKAAEGVVPEGYGGPPGGGGRRPRTPAPATSSPARQNTGNSGGLAHRKACPGGVREAPRGWGDIPSPYARGAVGGPLRRRQRRRLR